MINKLLLLAGGSFIAAAAATVFIAADVRATASESELTVMPDSGPVGTTVLLEGSGCAPPGQQTIDIVFQNGDATGPATVGADAMYDIAVDGQGNFRVRYTIPADFAPGSLQGRGGGLLTPGAYQFISKPPICFVAFTVTTASLPGTGSEPPPAEGDTSGWILVLTSVGGLIAAFLGLRLTYAALRMRKPPGRPIRS